MDICSSYRTYLRQVRVLPHGYLRLFFTIKGADDFRSLLRTSSAQLRRKRLKRLSKDLQRLRAANRGNAPAFDRMLDIAYGRVGKLRWELMEPLLSKDGTRSPVYSSELAALLTSSISRTTKPLQTRHLVSPPGLSKRAESHSEDATLLGPLSRRREHNIRWRFFNAEWRKVCPPLQITLQHPENHSNTHLSSNPPLNVGFQNTVVLQELLALAGSPSASPDPTNNQGRAQQDQERSKTNPFSGNLPLRWLRRRYQALLGRVPLLISRPLPRDCTKYTYDIQLADSAIATSRLHSSRLRVIDAEEVSWISGIDLTAQSRRRHR